MTNKEYQKIKQRDKTGSFLKIRITEENKQALIKQSIKTGCSVSDIVRDIIKEAVKEI